MRQYYPLMPANGDQGPAGGEQGPPERPDYKVYRSRPGLLSRLRSPDLAKLRERLRAKGPGAPGDRGEAEGRRAKERPPWRRALKWVGIAALVWLALSLLAFAVSSQIQKGKLADMGDTLGGNPFMLGFPQTILVLGTDVRPSGLGGDGRGHAEEVHRRRRRGQTPALGLQPPTAPTRSCSSGRAGSPSASCRSRATRFAAIPGQDAQKINAAYAFGGAKLKVQTVEQFLGIDVDQVAVVDFDGFRDFIDAIGGVTVDIDRRSARRSRAELRTAASASS